MLPSAVPCALLHARQVVWEWDLEALAEMIELIVSELVTLCFETDVATVMAGESASSHGWAGPR